MVDSRLAETIADPRWFPFRFDIRNDEFHFVCVPAEVHHAVTFLSDLRPTSDQRRVIPRSALIVTAVPEAPLHFILHSGLAGSTLLARALAQSGVVTTFKEPPILTDVIAFGLNASLQEADVLREQVLRLLARAFMPGEAVVLKMSSIGNGLVGKAAANRPQSRILCLHAPLKDMLTSLARRGLEGRLGGRKLFVGLRNSGLAEFDFTDKQLFEHSDLQLAALAWLAIQRMIGESAVQFGFPRLRSITSDKLFDQPKESLSAISRHFGLNLDVERQLASGVFSRHAKTGKPFDADSRRSELSTALEHYGAEIGPIVEWAKKIASANSIAWDLPYPLLD